MITEPRLPDPSVAALVSKLLLSPTMKWRHHGIGLLQAYVVEENPFSTSEVPDTEHRIHVWDPSLRLPDMDDSGLLHDHRFDLESYVLLGAMEDTEISLMPRMSHSTENDPFLIWEIQNARAKEASGEGWVRFASDEEGNPRMYDLVRVPHIYNMGSRYRYPKRHFHRSDVKELTVTLCTKRNQSREPARLLARLGRTPKHAFADDANRLSPNDPRCTQLVERASKLLADIARRG
jgi:hypothetical protein